MFDTTIVMLLWLLFILCSALGLLLQAFGLVKSSIKPGLNRMIGIICFASGMMSIQYLDVNAGAIIIATLGAGLMGLILDPLEDFRKLRARASRNR